MVDEKESDTEPLVQCGNKQCAEFSYRSELEQNGWTCPYCGKRMQNDT